MATITYTAARRLASGHTAGTNYTLEFDLSAYDPQIGVTRNENTSLGGLRETILLRQTDTYSMTATAIPEADKPLWEEFFASVSAGELFQFDPWGTIASPDNPVNVIMESKQFTPRRMNLSDYYQISLKFMAT